MLAYPPNSVNPATRASGSLQRHQCVVGALVIFVSLLPGCASDGGAGFFGWGASPPEASEPKASGNPGAAALMRLSWVPMALGMLGVVAGVISTWVGRPRWQMVLAGASLIAVGLVGYYVAAQWAAYQHWIVGGLVLTGLGTVLVCCYETYAEWPVLRRVLSRDGGTKDSSPA